MDSQGSTCTSARASMHARRRFVASPRASPRRLRRQDFHRCASESHWYATSPAVRAPTAPAPFPGNETPCIRWGGASSGQGADVRLRGSSVLGRCPARRSSLRGGVPRYGGRSFKGWRTQCSRTQRRTTCRDCSEATPVQALEGGRQHRPSSGGAPETTRRPRSATERPLPGSRTWSA